MRMLLALLIIIGYFALLGWIVYVGHLKALGVIFVLLFFLGEWFYYPVKALIRFSHLGEYHIKSTLPDIMYLYYRFIRVNPEYAAYTAERKSAEGKAEEMNFLEGLYLIDQGEYQEAASHLKAAIEKDGNPDAYAFLALLYYHRSQDESDLDMVKSLLEYAAEHDSPMAKVFLGVLYRNGNLYPYDYKKALGLFYDACNSGCKVGCAEVAAMYEQGLGVKKDFLKAKQYIEKSGLNA